MAGIGFELKKMLDQGTYFSRIKAYLYSVNVSSGPWVVSILVIGLLGLFQTENLPRDEASLFRATIIYIYAFSLIAVGLLQLPLTRYLADLLYKNENELYLPAFSGALIVIGILQSLIAVPFIFFFSGWTAIYGFSAYGLYLVVSFIWVAMIFLSAAKDAASISWSFAIGAVVSLFSAYLLGARFGISGYISGFTLGQVVIFLLLSIRLIVEFPSDRGFSLDFLGYLRDYPTLLAAGFIYNLAIWSDKFVFWFSGYGESNGSFLYTCFIYDAPIFIAYLTVIPSLALFLLLVETSFYRHYRSYYGSIAGKSGLESIMSQKESMMTNIRRNLGYVITVQGLVTLLSIFATPFVVKYLNMNWISMSIMRIGILGAFLHSLFLILNVFLFYFEFRREALLLNLLFLVLNISLSYFSLHIGEFYFGYGYFAACFLSLFTGVFVFCFKMHNLEYKTFMLQPKP